MKKSAFYILIVILSVGTLVGMFGYYLSGGQEVVEEYSDIGRPAEIFPDYSDVVIPANIAPLNFKVGESGSKYCVKIYSEKGEPIEVFSRTPKIVIDEARWHKLLDSNRGRKLKTEVFVKSKDGRWGRYQSITNEIAREDIDGYLVYRRIRPTFSNWRQIGIHQRNLRGYDESVVISNEYYKSGCVNCHAFCNNRTDKMTIGIRNLIYGSSALLVKDGEVHKVGTKFGYTAWHPSGKVIAYSVNRVVQFFHSTATEVRDVMDIDSLLAYYVVDSEAVKTDPNISKKNRLETYPTWSPDGRYLYFCSAALSWAKLDVVPPEGYDKIKYDLMRISYDIDKDKWGELERVLSAKETGRSILLPRISPDGRWLLFCMCDYGCFPVYRRSSDLYLIDLEGGRQSGVYTPLRLDINSDESESWHSWSSNSRWVVFSSKRQRGTFTRSYISYVDSKGQVHKPLVLPQKDPSHYDGCLWTYSVPELVVEPVRITKEKLSRVVRGNQKIIADFPVTQASPKVPAGSSYDEPWMSERE